MLQNVSGKIYAFDLFHQRILIKNDKHRRVYMWYWFVGGSRGEPPDKNDDLEKKIGPETLIQGYTAFETRHLANCVHMLTQTCFYEKIFYPEGIKLLLFSFGSFCGWKPLPPIHFDNHWLVKYHKKLLLLEQFFLAFESMKIKQKSDWFLVTWDFHIQFMSSNMYGCVFHGPRSRLITAIIECDSCTFIMVLADCFCFLQSCPPATLPPIVTVAIANAVLALRQCTTCVTLRPRCPDILVIPKVALCAASISAHSFCPSKSSNKSLNTFPMKKEKTN